MRSRDAGSNSARKEYKPEANGGNTLDGFEHLSVVRIIHLPQRWVVILKEGRSADTGLTSVLPNVPLAWSLSTGLAVRMRPPDGGGFPMIVNLSQDGSSSESASRSQEDWEGP
jgi:hypothetical protein